MSAFLGIFFRDGRPVGRDAPERGLRAMAHRGPDGGGIWSAGPAALGVARLITVSGARADPPQTAGDLALVGDIRLDNPSELVEVLQLRGAEADLTDDRIVLAAFERWGERCVEHLLGDFAFVVWDGGRRQVFCARDGIGVKPFYFHLTPGIFACASEVRGLVESGLVPRVLEETAVADYLAGVYEDRGITFFRRIRRLPAATRMTVSERTDRRDLYWRLDPTTAFPSSDDRECAEAFRERFEQAVRSRVRASGPVATFLSGGLDSSSIACAAAGLLPSGNGSALHTFSAVFPDLPAEDLRKIDERGFIESAEGKIEGRGSCVTHHVAADRLSPLGEHPQVLRHEDEPVPAPNLYLHWEIYRRARESGARVVLDGIDGDTTVSHGLEGLAELARRGRLLRLWGESRALARRSPRPDASAREIAWKHGLRPWIPRSVFRLWRGARDRGPDWADHSLMKPEFARRVGYADRAAELIPDELPERNARLAHLAGLEMPIYQFLMEGTDKAAAAFGIEPRYPFFDRKLMELCLSLPPAQKLRDGWTRFVLREAMAGILPDDIRWRASKGNLAPNFRRRLREIDLPVIRRALHDEAAVLEPYVDVSDLQRRFTAWSERGDDTQALPIYSITVLGLWLNAAF